MRGSAPCVTRKPVRRIALTAVGGGRPFPGSRGFANGSGDDAEPRVAHAHRLLLEDVLEPGHDDVRGDPPEVVSKMFDKHKNLGVDISIRENEIAPNGNLSQE